MGSICFSNTLKHIRQDIRYLIRVGSICFSNTLKQISMLIEENKCVGSICFSNTLKRHKRRRQTNNVWVVFVLAIPSNFESCAYVARYVWVVFVLAIPSNWMLFWIG